MKISNEYSSSTIDKELNISETMVEIYKEQLEQKGYIKKISLYEDKRIEIEFKFQDEIQALSEILEEGVIRCQMVNA